MSSDLTSSNFVISFTYGQILVQQYSLYFQAKYFQKYLEEFNESDILIIDGVGMDELKEAMMKLFIFNIKEVTDLFKVEDIYTVEVDLNCDLNAFDDDMKRGKNQMMKN